jgi:hypothetical protein
MKLERSKPEDASEYVTWMWENRERNNASLKSLRHCTVYKISGILHLPVKSVLMLESLAPNPHVQGKKRLLALRRAMNDLRKMYPHTEIYFLTTGGTELDEAAKFYGFTEMPYKVYRMRPDDRSLAARAAEKTVLGVESQEPVRADA